MQAIVYAKCKVVLNVTKLKCLNGKLHHIKLLKIKQLENNSFQDNSSGNMSIR